VFGECITLTAIPADLFYYCIEATMFNNSFNDCRYLIGNAPELWLRTSPTPTGDDCFAGCTLLSNYSSIPISWR